MPNLSGPAFGHEAGGEALREKLKLVTLGENAGPAWREFSSRIESDDPMSPRPDQTGCRFLVEDADTGVDLDIPGNEAVGSQDAWRGHERQKGKRGKRFDYRLAATRNGPIRGWVAPLGLRCRKDSSRWWLKKQSFSRFPVLVICLLNGHRTP